MPKIIIELDDGTEIESDTFLASVIEKEDNLCYSKNFLSVSGLTASETLIMVSTALEVISQVVSRLSGADLLYDETKSEKRDD